MKHTLRLLSPFAAVLALSFVPPSARADPPPAAPLVSRIAANVEFSDTTYPILLEQNLAPGKDVYSTADSGKHTYKDVGEFAGLQYLRTDTRWWNLETSHRFLEFDIDRDATIYVAYFKKLKSFDKAFAADHWLASRDGGWTDLRRDIIVSGRDDHSYGVFAKTLRAGRVTLPGNAAPGLLVGVGAHYLVFIGPAIGPALANVVPPAPVPGKIPAFPGAEGGGMWATGGRGGSVYEVTNLLDYGSREKPVPGSLRDAVSQPDRTVVFRVSGTIPLKAPLQIKANNLTIAGQTAPGDGIAVRDHPLSVSGCNQILRFLRSRPGDATDGEFDSFGACFGSQIICDHISAAWSVDEAASFRYLRDFTLQWSIIGESNLHAHHQSGAHGFGGIWGGRNATYHHNLVLHNVSRMPRFNQGPLDFRNNVFYNWGYKAEYGDYNLANFTGNYYKPGTGTLPQAREKFAEPLELQPWRGFGMFLHGNIMHGSQAVTANNLLGARDMDPAKRYILLAAEVPFPSPVRTQSAADAFESVLRFAGASPRPDQRDAVDARFVRETRDGTGGMIYTRPATIEFAKNEDQRKKIEQTLANHKARMVRIEFPDLRSLPPPPDTDHDGMPDAWETNRRLDPAKPDDRNGDDDGDGYTNLEEYLNELATPALPAPADYRDPPPVPPVDLSVLQGASAAALDQAPVLVVVDGTLLPGGAASIVEAGTLFIPAAEALAALGLPAAPAPAMRTRRIDGRLFLDSASLPEACGVRRSWDPRNRVLMLATIRAPRGAPHGSGS